MLFQKQKLRGNINLKFIYEFNLWNLYGGSKSF